MKRAENELFDRLGPDGLTRVLSDILDQPRLVRLANACGLEYPGMRTRSQTPKRVLKDLVTKGAKDGPTRKAIYRTLLKETRKAAQEWSLLTAEQQVDRLGDDALLLTNGNLGLHLFLLAGRGEHQEGFAALLAQRRLLALNGGEPSPKSDTTSSREQTRLRKQVPRLEKKIQHVEGQLIKARDSEKGSKRDLIERKGELAESRMLAVRLRKELDEALASQHVLASRSGGAPEEALAQLGRAVKKLASEQRKLAHGFEKLEATAARNGKAKPPQLDPLDDSLKSIQRELASMRRERRKEKQEIAARFDDLTSGMRREVAKTRKIKRERPRGGGARVGVFIDVQNMYYGARQLKGKLDFDALLQAAVLDRRLIQATAYVVESKEIDQSGFIALLEQRGIEVRRKTLRVRADGSMKGDWDMELALDILDGSSNVDVVVLVSGDGDFTSLVNRVKKMGPRVEVIGFPRTTSKALVSAADRFQPLDRKFMIYTRKSKTAIKRDKPESSKPDAS